MDSVERKKQDAKANAPCSSIYIRFESKHDSFTELRWWKHQEQQGRCYHRGPGTDELRSGRKDTQRVYGELTSTVLFLDPLVRLNRYLLYN